MANTTIPQWIELPKEVTQNILHRLGTIPIMECAEKVCKTWWTVCNDPSMWRNINFTYSDGTKYDLSVMYRRAVDRSRGEAVEINIQSFCNDDLLQYIALRCGLVKHLNLSSCHKLSGKALAEAATKFVRLEELHINFPPSISSRDVEVIGQTCLGLKSFTYNEYNECYPLMKNDEFAFSVAKNMSGLCHLQLIGNTMTNRGFQAILEGCRRLKSIDVRRCFNVVLQGDLRRRCAEQLDDLKCPSNTVCGHEWKRYYFHSIADTDPSYCDENNYCFGFSYY